MDGHGSGDGRRSALVDSVGGGSADPKSKGDRDAHHDFLHSGVPVVWYAARKSRLSAVSLIVRRSTKLLVQDWAAQASSVQELRANCKPAKIPAVIFKMKCSKVVTLIYGGI